MLKKMTLDIKKEDKPIKVYLDGEPVGYINHYALLKYGLKDDIMVDEERIDYIINDAAQDFAFGQVVKMARENYVPQRRAEKKLIEQGYTATVIELALSKGIEHGYINDQLLCESYISYKIKSQSKRKVSDYLAQLLISRSDIANAFAEVEDSDELELEGAVKRVNRIVGDADKIDYKLREKIYRNMTSQGYTSSVINSAINSVCAELAEETYD